LGCQHHAKAKAGCAFERTSCWQVHLFWKLSNDKIDSDLCKSAIDGGSHFVHKHLAINSGLTNPFKNRKSYMKHNKTFALILAGMTVGLTSQAGTVLPANITNNFAPTYTTADGLLTMEAFSDSASTVPLNLGKGGNYIGVGNASALSGTDTMQLQFAPGVGLTGFGTVWTRAVITVSGFVSDPGLNVGSDPNVISKSYSSGIMTLDLNWDGGTIYDFTLSNPDASAGQLLTISLDYATSPQVAFSELDYGPVPEPSVAALGLLGGLAAFASARRFRR
jgi:hypothetical protein